MSIRLLDTHRQGLQTPHEWWAPDDVPNPLRFSRQSEYFDLDDGKQVEPLKERNVSPANPRTPNALVEVEQVRRSGGYFVGSVGWSGLVSSLISRLVFFLVSVGITIGGFVCWVVLDESVRIGLRATLGELGSETQAEAQADRLFPILQSESRDELTVRWKQLLSEVQLEQSTYPPRFVAFVRELTLADIRRIDRIAPYMVEGAILRNSDNRSGHDVPALEWADFDRLKTIGVLAQGQLGQRIESDSHGSRPAPLMLRGKTLALLVTAADSSTSLAVPVTSLTEEGKLIVGLLDRATSLSGLCKGAARLVETGLVVRIRVKFEPGEGARANAQYAGDITSWCSRD